MSQSNFTPTVETTLETAKSKLNQATTSLVRATDTAGEFVREYRVPIIGVVTAAALAFGISQLVSASRERSRRQRRRPGKILSAAFAALSTVAIREAAIRTVEALRNVRFRR